jgi:uncharacterized membrane protein HdeD (DUF308 family)
MGLPAQERKQMVQPELTPNVIDRFRKYWWLFLIRGLLGIALGVFALIFPAATLWAFLLLIGAYLLVDGIATIAKAIQIFRSDRQWWVLLLEGILGVVVGILIFALPGISLVTLALLVGYWAFITGVLALVSAFRLRTHVKGEWLYLVFAVVSILFGLYVIVVPAAGLIYITLMISIYGFVAGITMIGLAFRARNATA